MSGSAISPLARLVLFIVCLSIAGTFVAGLHYMVIDRPNQVAVSAPPANGVMDCDWLSKGDYNTCVNAATYGYHFVWYDPEWGCCWARNR